METSPAVVRVWMPTILGAVAYLFLHNMQPVYWLFALPLLPILIFMVTLAEVHDEGQQIYIRMLWKSNRISKKDILRSDKSFLDGIGVLRLARFVLPWGRVYFVHEWSKRPVSDNNSSPLWDIVASAVVAISGFIAARVTDIRGLRIETSHARVFALVSAGVLLFLFAIARKKRPGFANFALFAATYLVGLVRW